MAGSLPRCSGSTSASTAQLVIVALVLPPLILLTRADRYHRLRVLAARATGAAALGWLAPRLGVANPVAAAADQLDVIALPVVLALWLAALAVTIAARRHADELRRPEVVAPLPADAWQPEHGRRAGRRS